MYQYSKSMIFVTSLSVLMACGSDDEKAPSAEFNPSLDVNEIHYQVREIQIEAVFEYENGSKQEFRNIYRSAANLSEESIIRRTIEGKYTLEVNEQPASVSILDSNNFEYEKNLSERDYCEILGKSQASGAARFDALELNFNLNMNLKGKDCPPALMESFVTRQKEELAGLNLNLIKTLQDSGLWYHEASKAVQIKVRIKGVSS
ncbi:MAG: hypothetical protein COV44_10930 [Deltaproteobacteria bacterium CG11_big_fil_rev_8_21_14_0_20_45_16]|nr:MAG: hypothetical protein COV44_10930 [Deltaproteobacteria bacterium CG11_big_fil_rev_8_21_14_0_20_45_16]